MKPEGSFLYPQKAVTGHDMEPVLSTSTSYFFEIYFIIFPFSYRFLPLRTKYPQHVFLRRSQYCWYLQNVCSAYTEYTACSEWELTSDTMDLNKHCDRAP